MILRRDGGESINLEIARMFSGQKLWEQMQTFWQTFGEGRET
jgi:hypothetical protein